MNHCDKIWADKYRCLSLIITLLPILASLTFKFKISCEMVVHTPSEWTSFGNIVVISNVAA